MPLHLFTASNDTTRTTARFTGTLAMTDGVVLTTGFDAYCAVVQQLGFADLAVEQRASRSPTRSTKKAGGTTLCFSAQASFSESEWQQHLSQHCAAVLQPQGLSWQGKGLEIDFSRRTGNGTPAIKITKQASNNIAIGRLTRRSANDVNRIELNPAKLHRPNRIDN